MRSEQPTGFDDWIVIVTNIARRFDAGATGGNPEDPAAARDMIPRLDNTVSREIDMAAEDHAGVRRLKALLDKVKELRRYQSLNTANGRQPSARPRSYYARHP